MSHSIALHGHGQDGRVIRTICQTAPMQAQGLCRPTDAITVFVPFPHRIVEHQRACAPASSAVQGLAHDRTHLQRQPGSACGGIYPHGFIKEQRDCNHLPRRIALPPGRSGANGCAGDGGCSVIRRCKEHQWITAQQLQS